MLVFSTLFASQDCYAIRCHADYADYAIAERYAIAARHIYAAIFTPRRLMPPCRVYFYLMLMLLLPRHIRYRRAYDATRYAITPCRLSLRGINMLRYAHFFLYACYVFFFLCYAACRSVTADDALRLRRRCYDEFWPCRRCCFAYSLTRC